jgi:hypothetical protein
MPYGRAPLSASGANGTTRATYRTRRDAISSVAFDVIVDRIPSRETMVYAIGAGPDGWAGATIVDAKLPDGPPDAGRSP